MIAVGIDLAGVEKRPTGFCILNQRLSAKTCILHSNKDIINAVQEIRPQVVSVDAPLALPRGRPSLSVKYRNYPHLRECDKDLLRMGIKFFPITIGPMRKLTRRGMKLRRIFEAQSFKVIESFPGGAQDVLRMPRKQAGLEELRKALIDYGVKGDVAKEGIGGDELDAVTSALVGILYLRGQYHAIGDPEEALLILPKPRT